MGTRLYNDRGQRNCTKGQLTSDYRQLADSEENKTFPISKLGWNAVSHKQVRSESDLFAEL